MIRGYMSTDWEKLDKEVAERQAGAEVKIQLLADHPGCDAVQQREIEKNMQKLRKMMKIPTYEEDHCTPTYPMDIRTFMNKYEWLSMDYLEKNYDSIFVHFK